MEYSAFLVVFVWWGFGLVADVTTGISIENCDLKSATLDVRENTENNITCKGLEADATVTWYIKRSVNSPYVVIATCAPFNCTDLQTDEFTVHNSPQESQLVYRQQNRTEDFGARIMCESVNPDLTGGRNLQTSCKLNVISPANLSGCAVKEDREKRTVKGSCHFERAFSARTGITCMWYQTKSSDQSSASYEGDIIQEHYTSSDGHLYERGHCNLSISGQQWNDVNYSYIIDFYPGPGLWNVPVQIFGSEDSSSGTGHHSTPTSKQGLSNDPDTGDDSLPVAAIAGGVAVAVVVIIVVVVIVVVVARRRQRRKPAETPNTPRENDYWEEHINAAYVSCDGNVDDEHDASLDYYQRPTPTTTTAAINDDNNTRAVSRLYASADGDYEDADLPGISYLTTEDGYDGYSAVGPTRKQARAVPEGADDYTVVDDSRMGTGPSRNGTGPGNKPVTDTYAVVDKSRKETGPNRNGTTAPVSETYAVVDKSGKRTGPNRNGTIAPVSETYAVVDKPRKRNALPRNDPVQDSAADDYSEAEQEGDPYSHLQLSSAAAKPVPPKKPTLKAEVTQSAAGDDVYNKLNFN